MQANGSATVAFTALDACDLGFPYVDRLDALRWHDKPVLDAWLDRWGMQMLPVREGDRVAVLVAL